MGAFRAASGSVGSVRDREEIGGYRLVEKIGFGGMSTVYRALDGGGQSVALKLLHPSISADPNARDRLRREVRTLRQVTGPYVAHVIDAETEDDEAFIVTELIDGPTLSIDVSENGVFDGSDLADLAKELAEALQEIHDKGVLHRDLKPSNVMMSHRGPVLIDFGIAQIAEESRLTATGLLAHTPGYAAPEVLNGEDPTASADWWSWAATLAYAATGHAPFGTGHSPKVTRRVLTGECDLAGADPVVAYALEAALNPRPERRPSPKEVIGMLDGSIEVDEDALELGPRYAERVAPPDGSAHPPDVSAYPAGPGAHPAGGYPADVGIHPGRDQYPAHTSPDPVRAPDSTRLSTGPMATPPQYPPHAGPHHPEGRPAEVVARNPYDVEGPAVFRPMREPAVVAQARFDPRFTPAPVPDWLRPAPRRPGIVLMLWVVFVAWAGVLPTYSLIVFVLYAVITSTVGVARDSLIRTRLEKGGRFRAESITVIGRLPLSTLGGLARTAASVGSGIVVGGGFAWFLHSFLFVEDVVAIAGGSMLGSLLAWLYPTSRPSRETTRHLIATIAPSSGYRLFWTVLAVALISLALAMYSGGVEPDWSPLSKPFPFD